MGLCGEHFSAYLGSLFIRLMLATNVETISNWPLPHEAHITKLCYASSGVRVRRPEYIEYL